MLINKKWIYGFLVGGAILALGGCPKTTYPNCKTDSQCNITVDGVAKTGVCIQGKCQECSDNGNCQNGMVCRDNMCESSQGATNGCAKDSDCASGFTCTNGVCMEPSSSNSCQSGQMVFFDFDQYTLKPEAVEVLNVLAQCISNATGPVTIQGHTDNRGTAEYNMALGERRANAVKDFFASKGIDATRMKVVSFGKSEPLVNENNDAAWAKNRRAVSVFSGK